MHLKWGHLWWSSGLVTVGYYIVGSLWGKFMVGQFKTCGCVCPQLDRIYPYKGRCMTTVACSGNLIMYEGQV